MWCEAKRDWCALSIMNIRTGSRSFALGVREILSALHDSEKARKRLIRWRGGHRREVARSEGWGCVEATYVSKRVSSYVDEATTIRSQFFCVTTEMRLAWDKPRRYF